MVGLETMSDTLAPHLGKQARAWQGEGESPQADGLIASRLICNEIYVDFPTRVGSI
ncbi:hypothetical protein AH4AK4_3024 [Aeromonas hydrophila 4AK4]|nr:hypothetical protein AH4AK4_3024 [Aeromonas hydrophila 4AK4]